MADRYNPHFPLLLGQEWVPIKDEKIQFIPASSVEYGYRFRYDGVDSSGMTDSYPFSLFGIGPEEPFVQPAWQKRNYTVNLYREGDENRAGIVRTVTIPAQSFSATGNTVTSFDSMVEFQYTTDPPPTQAVDFYFDANPYRTLLWNKRILNVSFLYAGSSNDIVTGSNGIDREIPIVYDPQYRQYFIEPLTKLAVARPFAPVTALNNGALYYLSDSGPRGWGALPGLIFQPSLESSAPAAILRVEKPPLTTLSLGNVVRGYDSVNSFDFTGEWSFEALQKLNRNANDRFALRLYVQLPNTTGRSTLRRMPRIRLMVAALQITFVDENRMASVTFEDSGGTDNANKVPMLYGMQRRQLRNAMWAWDSSMATFQRQLFHRPGAWPKGNYVLTVSYADQGEDGGVRDRFTPMPVVATRELYQNPSYPGVRLDVPFPAGDKDIVVGQEFTVNDSPIMPQLFLAPNTGSSPNNVPTHAYSSQLPSPVYGNFRTVQKIVHVLEGGLVLDGTTGNYASTPDHASLDTVADVDIRADVTLFNWANGTLQALVAKYEATGNQRSYQLAVDATGNLRFSWSTNGTLQLTATSTIAVPAVISGTRLGLRATLLANNGGGSRVVTFYYSLDAPTLQFERLSFATWIQLGSTVTGAVTSIFNSTAPLLVGATESGALPVDGIIHSAQVRNSIDGSLGANPDFAVQDTGTTSFLDSTNKTWTLTGSTVSITQIPADTAYNKIRFWARRFGDTSVPLRVQRAEDPGLYYNGFNQEFSTPDDASLDITGDIDIRVDFSTYRQPTDPNNSVSQQRLISKDDSLNVAAYVLTLDPSNITLTWSADGISTIQSQCPMVLGWNGSPIRASLRVTLDVNNGAAGYTVVFYTGPTINGPWTPLITNIAGPVTSIFNSTAPLFVGTPIGALEFISERTIVHSAEVRNGIDGTIVANPEFGAQIAGTTSFTDSTGKLWSAVGNPVIIDAASIPAAEITPAEFDELEKITTDGWAQVDLEFSPSFIMPTERPWIRWSADGEHAGSRWEILAAAAYEVSGAVPGNWLLQPQFLAFTANQTWGNSAKYSYGGTDVHISKAERLYQEPGYFLTPQGPGVSGYGADYRADASFILSQSPPPITGFGATNAQQVLVTSEECGTDPSGIPTDLEYLSLSWDPPPDAGRVKDTFDRSLTGSWGDPDFGNSWSAWSSSTPLSVADGFGYIDTSITPGIPQGAMISGGCGPDFDLTLTLRNVNQPYLLETPISTYIYGRYLNSSNYYWIEVTLAPAITGTVTQLNDAIQAGLVITLGKTVAGIVSVLDRRQAAPSPQGEGAGAGINLRFAVMDDQLKVKYWDLGNTESPLWFMEAEDIEHTTGTSLVLLASQLQGQAVIAFSDLELTPPKFWFDSYEIQRMDEETDWQTIMKATNPATTEFNDYEARAGLTSRYRIRQSYVYEFHGAWSAEVSGMVPAPGVQGNNVDGHLLMFTTNERQDGSSNAAYASVWENGMVSEDFNFPESTFVQMQAMYNRDFYTAFRPLERGGEQFDRDVLVQAMAISPTVMANFTTLRDLAWDSVNYICVRDEDGNRWLASVQVPSGRVRRRRTIYIAPVHVVETTDTVTPVDPVWAP